MDDTLKEIVELSDADYQKLANYGSVNVDGITIQYTPKNSMYVTPDDTLEQAKAYTDKKVDEIDASLANKVNKTDATVQDTATDGKYVSAVSQTNGVINVTRTDLPDYSQTYEPIGAAANAETAAKEYTDDAIGSLDVTVEGMDANKTLASLSETDGKIAATFQDISITKSQISDFNDSDYDVAGAASSVLGDERDTEDEITVYGVKRYALGCVKLSDVSGTNTNSEILTNIAGALVSFMPWYEGKVETE